MIGPEYEAELAGLDEAALLAEYENAALEAPLSGPLFGEMLERVRLCRRVILRRLRGTQQTNQPDRLVANTRQGSEFVS